MLFILLSLPGIALTQSPTEFFIPPPPVPTSSFTYPFPELPPLAQIFSTQSFCRQTYTTCMDVFQDCLRAVESFNGAAQGASQLCEQWRGDTCEGGVRVGCDRLPPDNQGGGDGNGGDGINSTLPSEIEFEFGTSSTAATSSSSTSSTQVRKVTTNTEVEEPATTITPTESAGDGEATTMTSEPIATDTQSTFPPTDPTFVSTSAQITGVLTSSPPTLPTLAPTPERSNPSSTLSPTPTTITSIFNTELDITTIITFTTIITSLITTQTTLTTTIVNTDADGDLETVTTTTTMEVVATTTTMDRGLRFVGEVGADEENLENGAEVRKGTVLGATFLVAWVGTEILIGGWVVGGRLMPV